MGKGDTWDDAYELKTDRNFLSPLRYKFIPPIVPRKENALQSLKESVNTYLCKDCCSHKCVRMAKTLTECFDVIECYAGARP